MVDVLLGKSVCFAVGETRPTQSEAKEGGYVRRNTFRPILSVRSWSEEAGAEKRPAQSGSARPRPARQGDRFPESRGRIRRSRAWKARSPRPRPSFHAARRGEEGRRRRFVPISVARKRLRQGRAGNRYISTRKHTPSGSATHTPSARARKRLRRARWSGRDQGYRRSARRRRRSCGRSR